MTPRHEETTRLIKQMNMSLIRGNRRPLFVAATVQDAADDAVIFDFARVSRLAGEESELYGLL